MLREIARVLADEFLKRVVIVRYPNVGSSGMEIVPSHQPIKVVLAECRSPPPADQAAVMMRGGRTTCRKRLLLMKSGQKGRSSGGPNHSRNGVYSPNRSAHGNTLDNLVLNPTLSGSDRGGSRRLP